MLMPPAPSGTIWPPDWSQFLPDLAGSIVGGLLVGFAIWRFQSTAEDRAAERDALGSWEIMRHQIAWRFRTPLNEEREVGSWDSIWSQVRGVSENESALRVGAFLAAAPSSQELQSVATHIRDVERLGRLALNLDELLQSAMLRANRVMVGREDPFVTAAWYLVRGVETDNILLFMSGGDYVQIAGVALADQDVSELATELIALERAVIAQYGQLRDSLTQP
jgi:hypothetical protein